MNNTALAALLAALVFTVPAQALPYFDVHGEASAVAAASDAPSDFEVVSGSPAEELLSASAGSVGALDVATAGAIVGLDLLSTSADASGSDVSSAVSSARYSGAFVNSSEVTLGLQFSWLDVASGSGFAATTLFVSLVSDGVSLFSDYVQASSWSITYAAVPGTTSLLDLVLTSEASAAFLSAGPGNASSFGLVSVVPEPGTWLLFALGTVALGGLKLRQRRRAEAA